MLASSSTMVLDPGLAQTSRAYVYKGLFPPPPPTPTTHTPPIPQHHPLHTHPHPHLSPIILFNVIHSHTSVRTVMLLLSVKTPASWSVWSGCFFWNKKAAPRNLCRAYRPPCSPRGSTDGMKTVIPLNMFFYYCCCRCVLRNNI